MEWSMLHIIGPTLTGMVNLVLGVSIYRKKENRDWSNTFFALIMASVFFWALTEALFETVSRAASLNIAGSMLYISAIFIPYFFLLFTLTFPSETITLSNRDLLLITAPFILILILTLTPQQVLQTVVWKEGHKIIEFGRGYIAYILYIAGYFSYAFFNLFRKYPKSIGLIRFHLRFIIVGTSIAASIGLITNLLLPTLGYFKYMWIGPMMTILMSVCLVWGIYRYRLFNIKVILYENKFLALVKKGEEGDLLKKLKIDRKGHE